MCTQRVFSSSTKKTRYPPKTRQREHFDREQIAGRQAVPVRLQERLPRRSLGPLRSRVDPVVVQDPLHRVPGDVVAEVRERAAEARVAPPRILDRHPHHELSDLSSRRRPASTSAGAAVVLLGDQAPGPAKNRVRCGDACDLTQDPASQFLASHGESTALGIGQSKRSTAQLLPEDPILLPEIVDQILLVAVHPTSDGEHEELQSVGHSLRLRGNSGQHRPCLGDSPGSAAFSHHTGSLTPELTCVANGWHRAGR